MAVFSEMDLENMLMCTCCKDGWTAVFSVNSGPAGDIFPKKTAKLQTCSAMKSGALSMTAS